MGLRLRTFPFSLSGFTEQTALGNGRQADVVLDWLLSETTSVYMADTYGSKANWATAVHFLSPCLRSVLHPILPILSLDGLGLDHFAQTRMNVMGVYRMPIL